MKDKDMAVSNQQEIKNNFALYFLFPEAAAFNQEEIKERIQRHSNEQVDVTSVVGFDGKDKNLFVHITVDGEKFDLVGVEAPLPQNIINYTIGCAYGDPEEIQRMKEHGFHVLVYYKGTNKNIQAVFNSYKKLAYGFLTQGLLCVVNPYSWNVIAPGLIQGMMEDEETRAFSETPAMMIWRSFIKIPYENGVWFVTKGNNLFNVSEYAYFGSYEEAQDIYDIFETIFSYVYEGEGSVEAGDKMQISEDEFIAFKDINEVPELLREKFQGETLETLVIQKLTKDEVEA